METEEIIKRLLDIAELAEYYAPGELGEQLGQVHAAILDAQEWLVEHEATPTRADLAQQVLGFLDELLEISSGTDELACRIAGERDYWEQLEKEKGFKESEWQSYK